jgi:hypothetical protein
VLILVFFFIIFVVANCWIHLHFKRNRKNLLLSLEGTSYDWITNAKMNVTGKSATSYSRTWMRADLAFLDANIIIAPYNSLLGGRLRQSQPILQYSFRDGERMFAGVNSMLLASAIEATDKTLTIIYEGTRLSLKVQLKTKLDLSDSGHDVLALIAKRRYVVLPR